MTESFGNGVSRTLSALARQFGTVIWQKGKPPLDAELNLLQQIQSETVSQMIRANMPSGFLLDPTRGREDFVTAKQWSNFFLLGNPQSGEAAPVLWANVNGWIIPVVGTQINILENTSNLVSNVVRLSPPPSSNSRVDFVFLEVWQAIIAPNTSTVNKPSADKIWKYGNVEFGSTNINDDLEDPATGYETSRRVQIQYRLRVFGAGDGLGTSLSIDVYPEGLGDPNILGQGAADDPIAGFAFSNMGETLGDPGLWRAGDGVPSNLLSTVDGYTYAVPVCAIFRRNSSTFVAVNGAGNPNHLGGYNRQPSASLLADPREAARVLKTPTLVSSLDDETTGDIQVNNLINSGFDDTLINFTNTFIVIDDEILDITAVNTSVSPATITVAATGRGRGGTQPTQHSAGSSISFYNLRPDGLFSDEISLEEDLYDMRHGVNFGDWDFQRLLLHNLSLLVQGRLKSSYKQGAASDSQGVSVVEVSYLHANRNPAFSVNQTEELDGPDGLRYVFSDAAAIQADVTVLCDNEANVSNGYTTSQFDTNNSTSWSVGADFKPSGFLNNLNGVLGLGWNDGSVVFLHLGGNDGTLGARRTFRDGSTKAVRFVSPVEYWKGNDSDARLGRQHPVEVRFLSEQANRPAAVGETPEEHPGPLFPLAATRFEKPFIVLGGILHPTMVASGLTGDVDITGGTGLRPLGISARAGLEIDLGTGFNFDTPGLFHADTGDVTDIEGTMSVHLINGTRTLFDMLTNYGQDRTGGSSEVYVVVYGDTSFKENNGAFKVIGAGTAGYTTRDASNATSIVVEPLCEGVADFQSSPGATSLKLQFRSQTITSEDGNGYGNNDGNLAALAIVLTGLKGETGGETNPWNYTTLGTNALGLPYDGANRPIVLSKMAINTTLLYHPGRGGTARVANQILQVGVVNASGAFMRQAIGTVDSSFPPTVGLPSDEVHFDPANAQLWNRLPSLGLTESSTPKAPSFGGRTVAFSEQDREHELFVDKGSKTVVFRPFQNKPMTIAPILTTATPSLVGATNYPGGAPKDGANIFTTGLQLAYAVPPEYMPRFGRQDIPYFTDVTGAGSGTFLEGVTHLFGDTLDPTSPVFHMIGGQDNGTGGNLVLPMFFQTGSQALTGHLYTEYGTIIGPGVPAYQARLTSDISNLTEVGRSLIDRLAGVVSSDLGTGLKGIQLPPFHGIARVYGVYDRQDFIDKGGQTFLSDRVTSVADPPTNLLRRDAKQQTLFIFENGAQDTTAVVGDHTYIIPSNALDLSKSPYYQAGLKDSFTDFDYVVEACVFGFARGFISNNNLVLARRHNGEGDLISEGSPPSVLSNVRMAIAAPAPSGTQLYVMYRRVPYQGDPYMTREGEVRTVTDFEARYGQVSQAEAYELTNSIEQFDPNGNIQVETPNARALQVLASVDFVTSLGTGKVGGDLYPGTFMDIGYTENTPGSATRIPESAVQIPWHIRTRAYTEGQRANTSRATLEIEVVNSGATLTTSPAYITITSPDVSVLFAASTNVTPPEDEFYASGTPEETASSIATQIANHPLLVSRVLTTRAINNRVILTAVPVGEAGNDILVEIEDTGADGDILLFTATRGDELVSAFRTKGNLAGGVDIPVNAGSGFSQIFLGGMTERLPLGILVNDADFLAENPLGDNASSFSTAPGGLRPVQSILPLTRSGDEFSRFFGGPGQLVAQSDGAILRYTPFDITDSPTGTKRFRLYRGGGALFVLSGDNPGGPIDWQSESFQGSVGPILKGGMLACKAMLVRNFKEEAFANDVTVTYGDEIQMVVATYAVMGNGNTRREGVSLDGIISPTGYGEGYAASDRYRLDGKPMYSGLSHSAPDPDQVTLAVFPGRETNG